MTLPTDLGLSADDFAQWAKAAEHSRQCYQQAGQLRYWPWRFKLLWILVCPPYWWSIKSAWQYTRATLANELEEYDPPHTFFPTPREALSNDQQYWDD